MGMATAIVVGTCLRLDAADEAPDQIGDIRLAVGTVPASRNIQEGVSVPAAGFAATDTLAGLNVGLRVDLGIYQAIRPSTGSGAVVIGINLFDAQQSGDSYANNPRFGALVGPIEMNAIGADVSVSYAFALSRGWHVEIGPFAGIGSANITDRDLIVGSTTDSTIVGGHGVYREVGGRVSIFYTSHDNSFLVHLGIAYYGAHASANFTFTGATGDLIHESFTIDESGISPSLGFGYRF
jgi:hypothetical protein